MEKVTNDMMFDNPDIIKNQIAFNDNKCKEIRLSYFGSKIVPCKLDKTKKRVITTWKDDEAKKEYYKIGNLNVRLQQKLKEIL